MNDELMKEVDEAVRQENIRNFWSRFGNYIIGASVTIVAVTVAVTVWKNHHTAIREDATSTLNDIAILTERQNYEGTAGSFEKIPDMPMALQVLANTRKMDLLKEVDKQAEALGLAKEVSQSPKAQAEARDYAALIVAIDSGEVEALEEATGAGRPFSHTAREIKAVLLADAGKTIEAKNILEELAASAHTPPLMRRRVTLLLASLSSTQEQN